jgi:hypothetical protein
MYYSDKGYLKVNYILTHYGYIYIFTWIIGAYFKGSYCLYQDSLLSTEFMLIELE